MFQQPGFQFFKSGSQAFDHHQNLCVIADLALPAIDGADSEQYVHAGRQLFLVRTKNLIHVDFLDFNGSGPLA